MFSSPRLVVQGQFGRTIGAENGAQQSRRSTSGIISQVGFSLGDYRRIRWSALGVAPSFFRGRTLMVIRNASEGFGEDYGATNSYEFSGRATLILGTHELKWGGGYITNRFQARSEGPGIGFAAQETADTNPQDTMNSGDPIASFILNVPDNANRNNRQNIDTRPGGVLNVFFQDAWKATPRLTFNYGLRYDVTYVPPYGPEASVWAGDYGGIDDRGYGLQYRQLCSTESSYIPSLQQCVATRHVCPEMARCPLTSWLTRAGKLRSTAIWDLGPRLGFA